VSVWEYNMGAWGYNMGVWGYNIEWNFKEIDLRL
jgi:hypothetical protein